MYSVVYKEIIEINGKSYEITKCDFSEMIQTFIDDGELPQDCDSQNIIDCVIDETPLRK
jgi:hypothetical protein